MLSKRYRLRKNNEILEVLKKGRLAKGRFLNLKFLKGKEKDLNEDGQEVSRFAVVVSKKIFRRAVDRNRAKRLVRESLRLLLKERKINGVYKMVFLVQSDIKEKKMYEVKNDIEDLFVKLKLNS